MLVSLRMLMIVLLAPSASFMRTLFSCCIEFASQCSLVFAALHEMQTRSSDENSVGYISVVHLSNAWIMTKEKKDLSRFLYHTKGHLV